MAYMTKNQLSSLAPQSGSALFEAILAMAVASLCLGNIFQGLMVLTKWEMRAKQRLHLFLDPRGVSEKCAVNGSGVKLCRADE